MNVVNCFNHEGQGISFYPVLGSIQNFNLCIFDVASVVAVYLMSVVPESSWYSRSAYFPYFMSARSMEAEALTSTSTLNGTLLMLK